MKISRFIWVVAVFAALLIVALALPQDVWASLGSLPAHPLIVHAIIVLVPVLSAVIVVGLFVRKMLAVMHLYVLGGLGLVATAVVGAKASGNALAAVVGLPEEHAEWGDILVPLVIALFISFAVFCVVTYYASVRWLAVTCAVIVGLLAIASSAMTVAVGHSGAESVWQKVWSMSEPTSSPTPTTPSTATATATADPTPTSSVPANPGITLSEVSQHNTAADCWAVVGESVYDLSGFIEQHPGGPVVVEAMCGTDATSGFMGQHAGEGRPERELASLLVGPLSR